LNVPLRVTKDKWKHPKLLNILELHRERILASMPIMAEEYRFRLPGRIVLRPLEIKGPYSVKAGRYYWEPGKGFSIALNLIYCALQKDKGLWVSDHEMAHIVSGIRFNAWTTHREPHSSIYNFCRRLK
jgi:hypothetical protein